MPETAGRIWIQLLRILLRNRPQKVTRIEKPCYAGKMYCADVPEGIILLCRDGSVPVWGVVFR